jgi:hypothetical protein
MLFIHVESVKIVIILDKSVFNAVSVFHHSPSN